MNNVHYIKYNSIRTFTHIQKVSLMEIKSSIPLETRGQESAMNALPAEERSTPSVLISKKQIINGLKNYVKRIVTAMVCPTEKN